MRRISKNTGGLSFLTERPPKRRTAPPSYPPALGEGHPENRSYTIIEAASRGLTSREGFYARGPEGEPTGSPQPFLRVNGEGVYVVDCPLGWPGKLVLDDREHSIFPGAVIPERYSQISLSGMALDSETGIEQYSDAPIILAVGPRGHEYRRPGYYLHRWRRKLIHPGGDVAVTAGTSGGIGQKVLIQGYDYWTFLYTSNNVSDPAPHNVRPEIQVYYPGPTPELILPLMRHSNVVKLPVPAAGDYFPIMSGGPIVQAGGIRGFYTDDLQPVPGGFTFMVRIPAGFTARSVAVSIFNDSTPSGISRRLWIAYAGYRRDS